MYRRIFLPVLVLIFLLLAGCVNTAAKRTETGLELDLLPEANKGFVVLKVIATSPISLLNPKWQNIKISGNGKDDELMDVSPIYHMLMAGPVPTESLYFAKLDAGEYQVTGMGSIGPGPGLLWALAFSDNAMIEHALPKFNVVAGRLANLGTVIYVPEIEKEQQERLFLLQGAIGKQGAKDALLAEAKRGDISVIDGGGWVKSPVNEVEALKQAQLLVSTLTVKKTNKGFLAGSHLGQVFQRTGPQAWNRETIQTLGRVFSLAEDSDGRVIAGSEYGQYFVKDAELKWRAYRLGNESGRVDYIVPWQGVGTFFVVTDGHARATRILLKKSIESNTEVPIKIGQLNGYVNNLLVTDKEIILAQNIVGIAREVLLSRIDTRTLTVHSKREDFWVADWQHFSGGEVKLTRQNGLSLYSSTSKDNLQTWTHDDTPGIFGGYWFDSENGLSLEVESGFSTVSNKLRKTTDGGKSWIAFGNALETRIYAGKIVFADDKEVLVQGGNMLYSTSNQGKTWEKVFPR